VEHLAQYPDVIWLVERIFTERPHISSFILDSEIVAEDPSTGELKSFQELSNRARKDVQLDDVRVSVCVFAFDLMYFNGEVWCLSCYKTVSTLIINRYY
jgi:DNA ligase-1